MTDIITRVARAIYEASPHNRPFDQLRAFLREKLDREARAAIEAMREPTAAMVQETRSGYPLDVYRAMIDQALKVQP